jgi:hypothetical protein
MTDQACNRLNRRRFLKSIFAAATSSGLSASGLPSAAFARVTTAQPAVPSDVVAVPDDGWSLWLDRTASWADDAIFLPDDVDLKRLPVHPPSGGWDRLFARTDGDDFQAVSLPTTVEEHFWGAAGERSYTPEEYRYAAVDPAPQNGAYRGVSWFYRSLEIPVSMRGRRILLEVRAARMRAEVYLNGQLTGYSILEELPFTCDLTAAALPGRPNRLAIRITNPGGRYDWVDGATLRWGKVNLFRSHGFGGVDRGLRLRAAPLQAKLEDVWVLNTPEPRSIQARVKLSDPTLGEVRVAVLDPVSGKVLAEAVAEPSATQPTDGAHRSAALTVPGAALWDLDTPRLYQLRATYTLPGGEIDLRSVTFGFRWYAPEGLGSNALFRLNGRRIKIYTAISWGFWGINGLFPTPQLAEREVTQAKRLNLNCLNFHRNIGKEEVLDAHDRLGLLRYMEPGGGKQSIGRLPAGVAANAAGTVMDKPSDPADLFAQKFMLEKCRGMVRAFRSHPSLIQFTLQNELGADLNNPASLAAIEIMHAEDPSRCVVLNDGFSPPPRNSAQAWFAPYSDRMYRSDREPWGEWWNNHQGAGDQWYDRFYRNSNDFTYRQPLRDVLVEFGEMEGCAVADNHPLMLRQILKKQFGGGRGSAEVGSSYDFADHQEIALAYKRFFERWGFHKAFPEAETFYRSLGNKCYESWQQYLENIRICDTVDFAAISGWESTAIENHSGIVDNLRNFKGDPGLIASNLLPLRPVAKQHALSYRVGERAVFDLFLLNETGRTPVGRLRLEWLAPGQSRALLGEWDAPSVQADRFSYTVAEGFTAPAFTTPGIHRIFFSFDSAPEAAFTRELWVTAAQLARPLSVGIVGVVAALRKQLAELSGVHAEPFQPDRHYDVLVASGVVPGSKLDRQIGEQTGLEKPPSSSAIPAKDPSGHIPPAIFDAVMRGTPLLAAVPDDLLADGVCQQLAGLGAFVYDGQVGDTRAPWMGNWTFVREHATFAGMPVDRVLGVHYQAAGKDANGLLIERHPQGAEPDVVMGYSRDHDRRIGAASFVCSLGAGRVLVHRCPPLADPLEAQWLANTLNFLAG